MLRLACISSLQDCPAQQTHLQTPQSKFYFKVSCSCLSSVEIKRQGASKAERIKLQLKKRNEINDLPVLSFMKTSATLNRPVQLVRRGS